MLLQKIALNSIMMFILSSSLSVWVKNCDALELPEEPRQQLEEFIDGLYLVYIKK